MSDMEKYDSNRYKRDPLSDYLVVILSEHDKVHDGDAFERHITSANGVVASLNVAFKTAPGNTLAHMLFGWASSDEVLFEIIEGASWDQGSGTALTVFNNNRTSSNTSTIILENKNQATFTASNQLIQDVTTIAGGTVIDGQYTYNAGVGVAVVAESRHSAHEWILAPDTTYVVRLTQTGGNCKMTIDIHWYRQASKYRIV